MSCATSLQASYASSNHSFGDSLHGTSFNNSEAWGNSQLQSLEPKSFQGSLYGQETTRKISSPESFPRFQDSLEHKDTSIDDSFSKQFQCVTIDPDNLDQETFLKKCDLDSQLGRRKTFRHHENCEKTVGRLAQIGIFYLGENRAQCYYCNVVFNLPDVLTLDYVDTIINAHNDSSNNCRKERGKFFNKIHIKEEFEPQRKRRKTNESMCENVSSSLDSKSFNPEETTIKAQFRSENTEVKFIKDKDGFNCENLSAFYDPEKSLSLLSFNNSSLENNDISLETVPTNYRRMIIESNESMEKFSKFPYDEELQLNKTTSNGNDKIEMLPKNDENVQSSRSENLDVHNSNASIQSESASVYFPNNVLTTLGSTAYTAPELRRSRTTSESSPESGDMLVITPEVNNVQNVMETETTLFNPANMLIENPEPSPDIVMVSIRRQVVLQRPVEQLTETDEENRARTEEENARRILAPSNARSVISAGSIRQIEIGSMGSDMNSIPVYERIIDRRGRFLSAYPCDSPRYPEMASVETRFATFQTERWPADRVLGSNLAFASSGFYYVGRGSECRCFYCGGGIQNWEHFLDEPWTEHAKYFPTCSFLLSQRGPDFVEQIQRQEFGLDLDREAALAGRSMPCGDSGPAEIIDPQAEAQRIREQLAEAINSETALQAKEMGFEEKVIKKAIKEYIERRNKLPINVNEYMDRMIELTDSGSMASSSDEETSDEEEIESRPPQRIVLGAAAVSLPLDPPTITELEIERRCKVCLDEDATVLFQPCNHLCACMTCTKWLRNCPLCRTRIVKAIQTYKK